MSGLPKNWNDEPEAGPIFAILATSPPIYLRASAIQYVPFSTNLLWHSLGLTVNLNKQLRRSFFSGSALVLFQGIICFYARLDSARPKSVGSMEKTIASRRGTDGIYLGTRHAWLGRAMG
jgi:hypothetical protein